MTPSATANHIIMHNLSMATKKKNNSIAQQAACARVAQRNNRSTRASAELDRDIFMDFLSVCKISTPSQPRKRWEPLKHLVISNNLFFGCAVSKQHPPIFKQTKFNKNQDEAERCNCRRKNLQSLMHKTLLFYMLWCLKHLFPCIVFCMLVVCI